MKPKFFFLVLVFMGFIHFMNAQLPSYVPTNGLVGYWGFTGNANDVSGNGNNGTVTGATLTTDRFGNANSAYSFNGSSNYINCGTPSSLLNLDNFTYSVWINKTIANTDDRYVISNYDGQNHGNFIDVFASGCYARLASGTGIDADALVSQQLNISVWNHIVVVKSNSTIKIYLNNILFQTTDISSFNYMKNSTLPFIIGKSGWANMGYFNGRIDDIGVWNRILTDQEISNLYNVNTCYLSVTDTLIINTGILSYNPMTYNNTITIYPNPAKDHITIDCGTLTKVVGYSIKIVNTLGQEVFNKPMNTQQYYVPLNSWGGQGMYFVNVIDAQGHTIDIKKIILQ